MLALRSSKLLRAVRTRFYSKSTFPVLAGDVDKSAATFQASATRTAALWEQISELVEEARRGGGEKEQAKHKKRNKMPPRDRVKGVLDEGSPFLEFSPLAGYQLYKKEIVPSAGIVSGIGKIHGVNCLVVANDATVKGGTYYPIGLKKHLRASDIGQENRLPCIYLCDSGGAFLPMQSEIFADARGGGRMFYNEAVMSSAGIPQLAAVMGSCTAGGAYAPAMCDEAVIVKGTGAVYLGGPPLVKAATGEIVNSEELGGADVTCRLSGLTDYLVHSDAEALDVVRNMVANLEECALQPAAGRTPVEEPIFDVDDMAGCLPSEPGGHAQMHALLARVLDGSRLFEFKPLYGSTLITGFGRLNGHTVGIVANNGPLDSPACLKGAHFIELCGQRGVPIVYFANTQGFANDSKGQGMELKDAGKMMAAGSSVQVPKITIVVGDAIGAAAHPMCATRGDMPRFLFSYPTARTAIVAPENVEECISEGTEEIWGVPDGALRDASVKGKVLEMATATLARQSTAIYGSARVWDDGIIHPKETRDVLAMALDVVKVGEATARRDTAWSNFRM